MVTKSAVRNTLITPSRVNSGPTNSSGASAPLMYVPGPPTGTPVLNFIALGFGVGATVIAIGRRA